VSIYIESSIEPLYFLTSRLQDHYKDKNKPDLGISVDRWSMALQTYSRLRLRAADVRKEILASPRTGGEKTLVAECSPNRFMQDLGMRLMSETEIAALPPADVIDVILDLAQAHYRRMWTSCSSEEKLLLFRIAKEGLVNRNAENILRPLVRRGLVLMDPNCRIMNESFRRFILTAERPEVIAEWQQRGGESAWARMRAPILLAVAVLGAFFFATQREAFNQSLGLVAALAASVPGVISLLGSVAKLTRSDPSKP
jgi:hypothetical protein